MTFGVDGFALESSVAAGVEQIHVDVRAFECSSLGRKPQSDDESNQPHSHHAHPGHVLWSDRQHCWEAIENVKEYNPGYGCGVDKRAKSSKVEVALR